MHVLNLHHLAKIGWHIIAAGIASWYGPGLWGNGTASGERLVPTRATCAVPSFYSGMHPYEVLVYAPSTGRAALCRVNDNLPTPGRVIDLSEYTRNELGVGDLSYVTIYRR